MPKNRRKKAKKRRIHPKYRADNYENRFSEFLVPENLMIDTKIFALGGLEAVAVRSKGPYMLSNKVFKAANNWVVFMVTKRPDVTSIFGWKIP